MEKYLKILEQLKKYKKKRCAAWMVGCVGACLLSTCVYLTETCFTTDLPFYGTLYAGLSVLYSLTIYKAVGLDEECIKKISDLKYLKISSELEKKLGE